MFKLTSLATDPVDPEARRLEALHASGLLDSPPEPAFDDVVRLAAELCGTPAALVTFVDKDRQWFKAAHGLPRGETPRSHSFCAHALGRDQPLVVPDALQDPRFAANPAVVGPPGVRFYAGVPVGPAPGLVFGTLCVIDHEPRQIDERALRALGVLARQISVEIRLRVALRERDQALGRLSTTLESIAEAMFVVAPDWTVRYLNPEAERVLRRPKDTLLGRRLWDEFPEAVGSLSHREYHRAFAERRPVVFEDYYAPLETWFEVRAYPSEEGLAVFFRDITRRRRTEDRLREQAALLDQARDAIIVRDLSHHVLYWNKSAELLYGWPAGEALGRSIEPLLYRDPAAFHHATAAALEKGEWTGRIEQNTRDGRVLTVDARWPLLRDADGAPRSILAINTDITERLKLEQQFFRAQRMESIGTLAGGIAHDLNNLLSPIVMGVDLLRQLAPDPRVAGILDNIGRSAQRGAELVKQVLSFARGVEGARIAIRVPRLLHEIEAIVATTFPKNIRFTLDVADHLSPVVGDPTQLHQVLLNLCLNARDAMPAGGRLALSVRDIVIDEQYAAMDRSATPGRHVLVEIADEGCGIPPDQVQRVFEPFYTTKELGKGTGLGLSTTLGIVRSHGGFLNVYSEPGKGSTFKVYLPAFVEGAPAAEPGSAAPASPPRGAGELVLLVDDEAAILAVMSKTLEAFGYRVLAAEDGAQAVALYAEHRADIALVITDMMMPVMDGPALVAALRRIQPAVRIIAASGLDANGNLAKAANAGVRHFLAKPYSADRLLALVRTTLDEPAA